MKILEHVTRYIYKNASLFKIQNINFPFNEEEINLRLVIDDETDLKELTGYLKNLLKTIMNSIQKKLFLS